MERTDLSYSGVEYDYDWRTKTESKIKNPYYMADHNDYDWYWKGN